MNKELLEIVKFTLPSIIIIAGWSVTNYLSRKRDRHIKKRDFTIENLIRAYKVLTHEVAHRKSNHEYSNKLEAIISEIQLFGSPTQIRLAKILANDVSNGTSFNLDPLINDLRNDLRKQLGLGVIEGNVTWLRFKNDYYRI